MSLNRRNRLQSIEGIARRVLSCAGALIELVILLLLRMRVRGHFGWNDATEGIYNTIGLQGIGVYDDRALVRSSLRRSPM